MLKKYPYTEILGWSVSRFDKFKTCKRQYYYEYYAQKHDPDNDRILLKQLKDLTSGPLETGHLLHEMIRILLERLKKSTAPIDRTRMDAKVRELVGTSFREKSFFEVYYNQPSAPSEEEIYTKVSTMLSDFLNSARYEWLLVHAVQSAHHWIIEPDGFGETRLGDLKAYCKVDFLVPIGDKVYILDWKSGKEELGKQLRQMMGYTAFACDHLGKSAEEVVNILYFLKDGQEKITTFTAPDIREFVGQIHTETRELYALTADKDRNLPLPKEAFTRTDDTFRCNYCNYRQVCEADKG